MKRRISFGLSLALLMSAGAAAQSGSTPPLVNELPAVSVEEIGQAIVAFANFAGAPGLSSAELDVRPPDEPRFELSRSGFSIQRDIILPRITANAFAGGSLVSSSVEQNFSVMTESGDILSFDTDRSLLSGRIGGGLSLPVTRDLKMRAYLSAIVSRLESDIAVIGFFDPDSVEPALGLVLRDTELDIGTGAITAQMLYGHWFGQRQLALEGTYTAAYSKTFNESDARLGTSGWSQTFVGRVRFSAPTGWIMRERPWRWNVYASHVNFFDQPRSALGFKYFHEIGAGLQYEWDVRPFNRLNWRYLGIRVGAIVGDDVDGWNIGISFR